MKGLYIHIPFCIKKCKYCDFISFPGCEEYFDKYLQELEKEMLKYEGEKIDTIFIGGGTPTILKPEAISKISKDIFDIFDVEKNAEFTIEANPKTLSEEKLETMLNAGINRLSIGVQSFNDNELISIGRMHNSFEGEQAVISAKKAGFTNINIDIMFSLPEQNLKSFKNTLEKAVSLNTEHISCYSLILEEGTKLFEEYEEGKILLPDDETDRENYAHACEFLKKSGYSQYEISNFSKKGHESRHNLKYWNCDEYIGLGVSAHSYYNSSRFFNTSSLEKYLLGEYMEGIPEKISREEKIKEFMIMGLRKSEGIKKSEFFKRFGILVNSIYKDEIDKFKKAGFLTETEDNIFLTRDGINVSNSILCEFV